MVVANYKPYVPLMNLQLMQCLSDMGSGLILMTRGLVVYAVRVDIKQVNAWDT